MLKEEREEPAGDLLDESLKEGEEEVSPTSTTGDETPQESEIETAVRKVKETTQKRINEITGKYRGEERKRIKAEEERDLYRDGFIKDKKKGKPEVETGKELKKPNYDDFDSDAEYLEALADWKVDQKTKGLRSEFEEIKTGTEEDKKEEEQQAKEEIFNEGRTKHKDFDAVALGLDVPYSDVSREAVFKSKNASELAYHLGKNLDVALRIAQIKDPINAAREIGIIEAELSKKAKVKTKTDAPEPIEPVSGSEVIDTELSKIDDDDEFRKKYNEKYPSEE